MKAFVILSIATPLDPANRDVIVRVEGGRLTAEKAAEFAENLKNTFTNPQYVTSNGATVACSCIAGVCEVEIEE